MIPRIVERMRGRLAFSPYKSSPKAFILHLMTAIAGTIQQKKKIYSVSEYDSGSESSTADAWQVFKSLVMAQILNITSFCIFRCSEGKDFPPHNAQHQ